MRIKRKEHPDLELKQIVEELREDPLHKFNIAFALMSIIPMLGFMYILVGHLFSFKILEGNVGLIIFVVILVSLLGFLVGHALIKSLLRRVINYMMKLQQNDKQKSIFVANVSHEIKNPLATLRLSITNILDGLVGAITDYQGEILKRCKDLCDRLIRFATDTLDISKIEAGKVELKRSQFEVNKLVDTEMNVCEPAFKKKHLELMTNRPFPRINIWADHDKLSQVIFNLIDNAIKYTPEKGKVLVNLIDEDRYARVEVCDTGEGIPPDKIDKIFDKFERVTSQQGGTGLGLAITKDFIELHRGRIWVESKLNEGSKFIVILPKDLRGTRRF
ncbi:MAG: HAMP domain-containing sensor histidine kinase [Candidatus Omnitrophica bacterium]|nr:HAMP domain-containing sensor histidine kinase [Candidatus Omnitrophota bacterium]MDD5352135.1 HAMP domain-containing sensor histidine kinase [Candidatus Omnitrophota bacterium]MDD5549733.1 HAMP domain-containing sensor histidine kinase [Candidatus Omnitrophota bacterium]